MSVSLYADIPLCVRLVLPLTATYIHGAFSSMTSMWPFYAYQIDVDGMFCNGSYEVALIYNIRNL